LRRSEREERENECVSKERWIEAGRGRECLIEVERGGGRGARVREGKRGGERGRGRERE